jgi:hypothetical protein
MGNLVWGWSAVYAIGVSIYAVFLARMYFRRNKR